MVLLSYGADDMPETIRPTIRGKHILLTISDSMRRKYLSPHQQELDDNIALGKLITDYIESQIDVFQIIRDEDDF